MSPPRQRGAIAVEFGLVTLIIVPLALGVVEFGRALYAYDTLTKSVRSAARYLAAEHDCQVTGIDLTKEYVEAATALAELVRYAQAKDLLVILDATGVTDVFPWIHKPNRR